MRYADSNCEVIESHDPEHTYTFVGPCVVTGKEQRVTVKAADLFRYRNTNGYVQECFHYLSKEDREFLISGTSGEGWISIFGGGDEESPDSDPDGDGDYDPSYE